MYVLEMLMRTRLTKTFQRLHLPTHDILKVRRVVHIRQFGKTYRQALQALKKAREFFPDEADAKAVESKKSTTLEPPRCAVCRRNVTQPCWFCVQCEGLRLEFVSHSLAHQCKEPSFICIPCEAKKKTSFGVHDFDTHDLVRCQAVVEATEMVLEERLADIERRFERHEAHLDEKLHGLELKMGERWSRVDQRLGDVERLLQSLLSALGPRPKESKPPGLSTYSKISSTSYAEAESYP